MSSELLVEVAGLVGHDVMVVEDAGDGWPGLVLLLGEPPLRLALHVAPVGFSHRKRDHAERRFQNPGKDRPLRGGGSAIPLLVGLWAEGGQPVLVAMDPARRMDRQTRQSLFIRLSELENARTRGWSEYTNAAGEHIYLFHPALFFAYVRLHTSENRVTDIELQDLAAVSGLMDGARGAEERVRRVSSVLARRAAFASEVLDAYGRQCAMCGLNLSLIEAAHVYPAHAPGSRDVVTNGGRAMPESPRRI
jgi:putative restriction endonuclease